MTKKRILLVDDSRSFRAAVRVMLSNEDYEVVEASSGEHALDVFDRFVDLVVLDLVMGSLDGIETCKRLRKLEKRTVDNEQRSFVPIIMLTAYDSTKSRKDGFLAGATDFIKKSDTRDYLISRVNEILSPSKLYQGTHALVLSDASQSADLIKHYLNSWSIFPAVLDDSRALEYLEDSKNDVDIILINTGKSRLFGRELCKRIRLDLGEKYIPILVVADESQSSNIVEIFDADATDYILKPFIKEELFARIKIHLDKVKQRQRLKSGLKSLEESNNHKDGVLASCIHDLRNPTQAIIGIIELIKEDEEQFPRQHIKDLESILSCADLQMGIIDDLIELARLESTIDKVELVNVSFEEELKKVVASLSILANKKGVRLSFKSYSSNAIRGDKTAINRLVLNLISNAVKFTDKGGEVEAITSTTEGNYLLFQVKDSGIGIPSGALSEIFKPFNGMSRIGTKGEKSTGLGLSICERIVKLHNGEISVSSKEGVGSIFEVKIPLASKKPNLKLLRA